MSNVLTGNIAQMGLVSFTYDPFNMTATATTDEDTVTVKGLKVGDFVSLIKPTQMDGMGIADCRVSAADTLSVTWVNPTGSAKNPGSETYLLFWARADAPRNSVAP